jgi:Fe-S oxidoreductase/nitrate reductase gamma subunit
MYAMFLASLVVALNGIWSRILLWQDGTTFRTRAGGLTTPLTWWRRLYSLFENAFLQRKVIRERHAATIHLLIYLGFLVLLFTTTMVFLDHDFGLDIYRGRFYLWVTLFSDLFGLGLLIGILLGVHRRYILKLGKLNTTRADTFLLGSLAALVIQGFLLEGLRIHVTNDPWARYSPVGLLVSHLLWPLSDDSAKSMHFLIWWLHTANFFIALALLPYSKFFHIFSSSANLYFAPDETPKGALSGSEGDIEKRMENEEDISFGVESIKDLSWKHRLDLDACTSCGRCQEVCPAYNTGKPLSPKWLILDARDHMLELHVKGSLGKKSVGAPVDQILLKNLYLERTFNKSSETRLMGGLMDANVYWSCTTCYACVTECPVGINHVDHIIASRRNAVLMHGELPSEASSSLRAIETRGNPFASANERFNWAAGLGIEPLNPGAVVDYLYWVGCVSAYDKRKQNIARSLVKLMQKAGLSFGVLGNAENCTGDPARRLGDENLFQSMTKGNLATLQSITFKNLVANCPHCFNTIKNEYPYFGNLQNGEKPRIIHHSVLLKELLKSEKLTPKNKLVAADSFTFHDPCYLGRYNDEYEAPRDTLVAIGSGKLKEMAESREKGLCCGAGGGHFWMDLKIGERINSKRVLQASATNATQIATACPFCMQMLEDGAKATSPDSPLQVRDIAEVVAEAVL